ncbi:MAG TPA: hypothetical protein VFC21_01460 [Bryobacteraceae bacterium]|nr:hypothetical protein [Bryobacteraceae bacterium]
MTAPASQRVYLRPVALSLLLFLINGFIVRELFGIEFLNNLSSNDGAFISLARFYREHGTGHGWFPWFNAGMPIENAYQPLLPAFAALTAKLAAWPIGRAFHFVLAMAYCCGPVTLFWFVWEWSESVAIGFIAGLAYSLASPAELLIPILRIPFRGHWGALRLYNLIHYAEDPHNLALTLLPLALLFLHRTIMRRTMANGIAAVVCCASVVAANAFGGVDLAIGALCMVLALNRGLTVVIPVGLAAYLWVSPWLPPTLIDRMRHDQWGARGYFNSGARAWLSVAAVLGVFAVLWFAGRFLKSRLERFSMLFAFWMCVIPLGFFLLNLTLVPQGSRYQLEMEMGLCLWFACLCAHVPWRGALMVLILLGGAWQVVWFRQYARALIQPVDIRQTIQYKADTWIDKNLRGRRTMVSGDAEYLFNIFSDNPQMIGGHEPTAPNWDQLVAVYTVYTGTNAGEHDAEYSLLWLKAFGNHAIYVPGEKSRENYHPIAHPHKFDGLLPVLWHEEDDTIFGVPQRSESLAHVIPREAAVVREPIHGLDVDPIRPYVAALEDPALPVAGMDWRDSASALIRATAKSGQVISVQVNWAPGWRASVGNRAVPVRKDGIGLMVLDPGCSGPCEIHLDFGVTKEAWICRILSGMTTLGMIGIAAFGFRERRKRSSG